MRTSLVVQHEDGVSESDEAAGHGLKIGPVFAAPGGGA